MIFLADEQRYPHHKHISVGFGAAGACCIQVHYIMLFGPVGLHFEKLKPKYKCGDETKLHIVDTMVDTCTSPVNSLLQGWTPLAGLKRLNPRLDFTLDSLLFGLNALDVGWNILGDGRRIVFTATSYMVC